jgi:hypothetical protein
VLAEQGPIGDDRDVLRHALEAPVQTIARQGPLLRAVAEAASHDEHIERGYRALLDRFAALIESYLRALKQQGLTQISDPHEAAHALNLMNISYLIETFGRTDPRVPPEVALQTLTEIWVGAVFGHPANTETEDHRR